MSQTIWSTINPNTTSGTQLATILDDFKNAVVSGLSGTTRPSELQAGGAWIDTTNELTPNFYWSYKVYDGTNDIEIFRVNLNTLKATIPSTDAFFEISKITADIDGALLKFIKQRIANNGQVLTGDTILDIQAVGRGDDSSDPNVARIRVEALDDMGAAASGATIIFEATTTGSTTIQEIFRVIDGKMGIGTETPGTALDVLSNTGIQSSRSEDSVNPAEIILNKKRATGFGATLIGDTIGRISSKTTDDAGASNSALTIETVATENHTAAAQGTRVDIKNTDIGSAIPSSAMTIGSTIEHVKPTKVNALEMAIVDIASAATITALGTTKSIVRLTGVTATELQGIDATGSAKVVTLHNGSSADITLKDENAGAIATDRIILPDNADLIIGAGQSVTFFYSISDTRWKIKSSSVGGAGGSGEGGINYIKDADAETSNNNVTVTANITKAFETVAPLFGAQSHKFTVGTLATTADYFEFDMNDVDLAYVEGGKSMTIGFWYKTDVNYTNDDIEIRLRNVDTPGDILVRNDNNGKLQATATSKYFLAKVEVVDPDNTYSLRGYVLTAPSVASNITVDKVLVGPQEVAPGAMPLHKNFDAIRMTDLGVLTSQLGDIVSSVSKSATGTYLINFTGLTVAPSVVASIDGGISDNGQKLSVTAISNTQATIIVYTAVTTIDRGLTVHVAKQGADYVSGNLVSTTETLFSTSKTRHKTDAGQSISTGSITIVDFDTVEYDNQSLVTTGASWKFTAPKTSHYKVHSNLLFAGTTAWTESESGNLLLYKNGVLYSNLDRDTQFGATSTFMHLGGSDTIQLDKGDYIDIRVSQNSGATIALYTGDLASTFVSVEELPDFSVFGVYGETEYIEAKSAGLVSYLVTADQFGDLTSIILSPGEWDINCTGTFKSNGTTTTSSVILGIGTVSGNAGSGMLDGSSRARQTMRNASGDHESLSVTSFNAIVTSPTTYYLKAFAGTSITNLQVGYKISARRIK